MGEGLGKVYLIGAGPGDPGLFTLKGKHWLEQADVVAYDAVVNHRLLAHAKPSAELISVGGREGQHVLTHEGVGRLLVDRARAGMTVARLVAGDPFVFGDGGEEAEELAAAGIPFEVVPGVTLAGAAPAYAGIPLTHRDFTSTVALIVGRNDATEEDGGIAWDRIATGIGTLVFYTNEDRLPDIAKRLMEHGRSPETPAAVIRRATRADQSVMMGTLAALAECPAGMESPVSDRDR